jgi:lipoprotein-anchoring transpeptidase ErfK/SrfK
MAVLGWASCANQHAAGAPAPGAVTTTSGATTSATAAPEDPAEAQERARIAAEFPLHGLVTGAQLKVRDAADPTSLVLGWLRVGGRVRLASNPTKTATCASGFYRVYPRGFACAGEGIEVADTPPQSELAVTPPAKNAPLPYRYFLVKEPKVPEYHRLPSRDDQRGASAFLERYFALAQKNEDKAEKFLRGELPNEPKSPSVVRRYLERGFFVAGAALEERAFRQFVRTVRGTYVKQNQLEERTGSDFRGVELDATHTLPVAWAVREATAFSAKPKADGSLRFVTDEGSPAYARHAIVPWVGRARVGGEVLHKLSDGRYLKHWFASVAEKIQRPKGIEKDEPWVHVNIDQQTLVLYRGDDPVYATLVSSGMEGHDSPLGLFEIRAKYMASTMSDIGPDAGDDRYSIEDVPWTQFFSGSVALHGAFWHDRFGLRRSHGCINLAPYDAHRVFNHTWPTVSEGWHGVSTDKTGFKASKVYVTAE